MSFRTLEVSERTHLTAEQLVTVSGLMVAKLKSPPRRVAECIIEI